MESERNYINTKLRVLHNKALRVSARHSLLHKEGVTYMKCYSL
jgi:hypothetical protein